MCGLRPQPKFVHDHLAVHEIANGPLRQQALDKPYAVLVACWPCNSMQMTDKKRWPEPRQLSLLLQSRPEDFDLAAYNYLLNPNAPYRITIDEVRSFL